MYNKQIEYFSFGGQMVNRDSYNNVYQDCSVYSYMTVHTVYAVCRTVDCFMFLEFKTND